MRDAAWPTINPFWWLSDRQRRRAVARMQRRLKRASGGPPSAAELRAEAKRQRQRAAVRACRLRKGTA